MLYRAFGAGAEIIGRHQLAPGIGRTLRGLTGRDPAVAAFLERHPEVAAMQEHISDFLARWLPGFERENRSYLTVAIGCTGGQHRSVYLAERLAAHFRKQGVNTQIRHRELTEGLSAAAP
jgi:UPF0042 nucleotide-binding protein